MHVGVDGCPAGWIVAQAPDLETAPRFWVAKSFRDILSEVPKRSLICIDVPIGLSDRARACDAEARRMLGPRRACSVFTPPCRAAIAGRDAAGIRDINVRVTSRSLSAQLLGILPKIREVDAAITPRLQDRVRETHPEVVFAALAGAGLAPRKQDEDGRRARLRLLPRAFARSAPTRDLAPFTRSEVRLDDYVDALACLCVAVRLASGEARRLPASSVERDARGLEMAIWY